MSDFTKITLTIAVVLGIIALALYAYMSTEKLDDHKVTKVESNIEQHLNSELEELYDNEEEEETEEIEIIDEDDDFEEYIEPEEEDWIEDDTIIETLKPAITPATVNYPFLLIAGSYKSRKNADSKINSLKELGLDAEIVEFEDSRLFSVCIGRFESEDRANTTKEAYQTNLDIKAYIHKKRD